jgi:transcriptional regulator with XRE-family HTH domain
MFSTIAQRAWFAWHCLPRTEKGQPPPIAQLERDHGLSHAQLRKLVMGLSKRPSYSTLTRAAQALACAPEWLGDNEGEPPRCSVFVPPGPPNRKRASAGTARSGVLAQSEIVLFESKSRDLSQRARPIPRKRAR